MKMVLLNLSHVEVVQWSVDVLSESEFRETSYGTHAHTHSFNGFFPGQVGQPGYADDTRRINQFSEAEMMMMGWQWMAAWHNGSIIGRINKVAVRRARLVLGWVTIWWTYHLDVFTKPLRSTQPPTLSGTGN